MSSRPAVSDAGRPALRLVPAGAAVPASVAPAAPYAVVQHEITPSRWLLQTHDRYGLPGVCVVVTRPEDQQRVAQLAAWLEDFYRVERR